VEVDAPVGFAELLGILSSVPMDMLFGETSGLIATSSSRETPNLKAIPLSVSPDWTSYTKGVAEGKGVSNVTTRPSGSSGVALGVRVK
jgi:hypothetical protein